MTIDRELRLSYYRQVADIDAGHGIYLVQDIRTGKFYVKKLLTVYNADIYRYLWAHPIANTPRTVLVEEDGKVLTVIEEYIPGDTLEEILEHLGTLPEDRVIDITTQLCRILADFHRCSPPIVNRDIKPSNIKITPDGIVKLLDMNAAKWSDGQSPKDTVLLGTQGYAAPEQYGFGPSSTLTDIYSVGVLMNEMLTGSLPNRRVAEGPLGDVVRRCTEWSPAGRYQSIGQLQNALDILSGKTAAQKAKAHWKRFLPPGFRSKNVVTWLFSALGYGLLFLVGSGINVENAGTAELALNRGMFLVAALCIVFFNGNYLNVHQTFSMTRSKYLPVRWLGMVLVDIAIFLFCIVVMNVLVGIFVS